LQLLETREPTQERDVGVASDKGVALGKIDGAIDIELAQLATGSDVLTQSVPKTTVC